MHQNVDQSKELRSCKNLVQPLCDRNHCATKMDIGLGEIAIGIAAFLLFFYYHLTKNFDFWEKRQVLGPKPIPFFGNFKDVAFRKVHLADYLKDMYDTYTEEPAVGVFFRSSPALLLRDPEIIRDVMIKSFSSFADRGVKIYADIDPLAQHLLYLEYDRWKLWRKKLTPTFSSGKLKDMFYLVNECADQFDQYLDTIGKPNFLNI